MAVPRTFTAAAILAAIFSPAVWPAFAQSGTLSSLKATGSKQYDEARIVSASGLRPGAEVNREKLQAAADHLSQLGPFRNVRYKFSSLADRVSVTFELEDTPAVPVAFDNFPWFTDEEIVAALRAAVPLFDGTAPEQGTMLSQMDAALEALLATRSVKGRVEHTLMAPAGAEGMMQQFRVTGPTLKVGAVRFEHPLAAQDKRIQAMLSEIVGKPYSRFVAELFAFEQVRPVYLENGCLRARFLPPQVRFTGDPRQPLADHVLLIFPIEPGAAYRWAGATWSGNSVHHAAALDAWLGFAAGETANGQKLTGGWERIRSEYGRLGYLEATLEPVPEFDDAAARVSFQVRITEGVQYLMGGLTITGLSVNAERTLRAAWRIPAGEVFDRVWFDEFHATGINKLFADTPVHFTKVGHWLQTDPATRTVTVLLDFQ